MQTDIELHFADGTYRFFLGLAQINELQAKCGIGIGGLFARVAKGRARFQGEDFALADEAQFHLADIVEPIRQGLIGGGQGEVDGQPVEVTPIVANRLVQNYAYPARPLEECWGIAFAVLSACIKGYEPKKKEPVPAPAPAKGRRKKRVGSTTPAP